MLLFVFDLYIGVVAAYSSVLFMSMGGGGGGGTGRWGGGVAHRVQLCSLWVPPPLLISCFPPPPEVIELDIYFRLPPILAQIKN